MNCKDNSDRLLFVMNAGYPSDRFDLIWHIQNGKIEIEKQKCPGLDD